MNRIMTPCVRSTSLSRTPMNPTSIRRILVNGWAAVVTTSLFCAAATHAAPSPADSSQGAASPEVAFSPDSAAIGRILAAAQTNTHGLTRLAYLCDAYGARPSGGTNLELAIDWALNELRKDGFSNVRGDAVQVPHWVRGEESLELVSPVPRKMKVLGFGGTVATKAGGVTAPLLVVKDLEDFALHTNEARGRIVLYNRPYRDYGTDVRVRGQGGIAAAKAGAVGALLRSITPLSLQTTHTGMTRNDTNTPAIPFAAVTVEDAEMLQRWWDRGVQPTVHLTLGAQQLPDAPSRNIIAEIPGTEHPEEVVVLSGHFDSWDVGQGAMDDGGGVMASWESLCIIRDLGLKPRRTIRLVLWANEEFGLRGSKAYRDKYRDQLTNHVLAIESDSGVFKPTGFSFTGSEAASKWIRSICGALEPVGANKYKTGAGGADLFALMEEGVPIMDLLVDGTKYFYYHHTEADTPDKLDLTEFNQCLGAMAAMAFSVADAPTKLPR